MIIHVKIVACSTKLVKRLPGVQSNSPVMRTRVHRGLLTHRIPGSINPLRWILSKLLASSALLILSGPRHNFSNSWKALFKESFFKNYYKWNKFMFLVGAYISVFGAIEFAYLPTDIKSWKAKKVTLFPSNYSSFGETDFF
jgi:hypothetical protein